MLVLLRLLVYALWPSLCPSPAPGLAFRQNRSSYQHRTVLRCLSLKFYDCLIRLCEQIGCPFDTAFQIALWGFTLLFHISIQSIRWLFSRRKKNRP